MRTGTGSLGPGWPCSVILACDPAGSTLEYRTLVGILIEAEDVTAEHDRRQMGVGLFVLGLVLFVTRMVASLIGWPFNYLVALIAGIGLVVALFLLAQMVVSPTF
jgi:hypothetical protein